MRPHLSYRWPESFPLMAMMVLLSDGLDGYVLLALYFYLRKFGKLPFQILLENVTSTPLERLPLSVH
jgi:hypothetical protein